MTNLVNGGNVHPQYNHRYDNLIFTIFSAVTAIIFIITLSIHFTHDNRSQQTSPPTHCTTITHHPVCE